MDAQLKNKVIGILRAASMRWSEKNEAKKLARVERGLYECAMCKDLFSGTEIHMDHKEPVIDPYVGWISFDSFIERLFIPKEGYQVLCENCHTSKTMVEKEIRKMARQQKKELEKEEKKKNGKAKRANKKSKREGDTNTDPA